MDKDLVRSLGNHVKSIPHGPGPVVSAGGENDADGMRNGIDDGFKNRFFLRLCDYHKLRKKTALEYIS